MIEKETFREIEVGNKRGAFSVVLVGGRSHLGNFII